LIDFDRHTEENGGPINRFNSNSPGTDQEKLRRVPCVFNNQKSRSAPHETSARTLSGFPQTTATCQQRTVFKVVSYWVGLHPHPPAPAPAAHLPNKLVLFTDRARESAGAERGKKAFAA
jgi:hypothetical protein